MRFVLLTIGVILFLLALLANRLGLDHDAAWGTSRYLMFYAGLLLVIFSSMAQAVKAGWISESAQRKFSAGIRTVSCWLEKGLKATWISILLTGVVLAGLSIYAVWYTSTGQFPRFKPVVNPYIDLGEAFLRGQVSLVDQPDPRLVALEDPYDFQQREKVPYNWDLTYYKGKYYIYWGPVPALFNALVEWITRVRPPDQLVVLFSYLGLGVIVTALLIRARKWYFPNAPGLSLPLFLLAALVNVPYLFILGMPQVYETSIIAGQFFLMLGVLAWLNYLNSRKSAWLVLCGSGWGLAIATRYNLALSVGLFLAAAVYQFLRENGKSRDTIQRAAAVLTPLALCGLGLALYNYARFENPLETGLLYQLTVPVYQHRYFSALYFPSNLYVYLLYPLQLRHSFPFIPSTIIQYTYLPSWAALPQGKMFNEVHYGILTSTPFYWLLAVLAPYGILDWIVGRRKHIKSLIVWPTFTRRQIAALFALAALTQFLFLMFYYYGAMRFNVDYYLPGYFALVFVAWELDEKLRRMPAFRAAFWLVLALAALLTAGLALIVGFDIPPQLFRANNPRLFILITNRSNRIYADLLHLRDSTTFLGTILRFVLRLVGLY